MITEIRGKRHIGTITQVSMKTQYMNMLETWYFLVGVRSLQDYGEVQAEYALLTQLNIIPYLIYL